MQSLATKFSIISLVSLLFSSCHSYQPLTNTTMVVKEQSVTNPYFANPEIDYVYKAQIDVYGNALSGLLVVKKTDQNLHRVVMTTDFGNKLLDFSISENQVKMNYVLEDLNRKMVLKVLAADLKLLVQENYVGQSESKNQEVRVVGSNAKSLKNYFFFENNQNQLKKIVQASKCKPKLAIIFETKNTNFAEQIFLEHYNFDIKINLKQIIKE